MKSRILLSCLAILFLHSFAFAQNQAPVEPFKPSGKVWGYAFSDVYYKAGGDTATWSARNEYSGVPHKVYAFALRRMYLGYDYNISPTFSTTALLEANDNILASRGDRSVTIKALNVRWKNFFSGTDLIVGQMSTLAFSNIVEKEWNYRSVEKTIVDMRGLRSSSDMGVALHGRLDSAGLYGYALMIGNGSGTRPEELTDAGKHKLYSGEVYGYFLDRKIVVNLYGDYQTGLDDRTVNILKGYVGFRSPVFTLGAELFTQRFANVKSDGKDVSIFGFSVFARNQLIKDKLWGFARFDSYNPDSQYRDEDVITTYSNTNMFRHYDETFFLVGLDYTPHKNVHIMPNLWVNSYTPKAESDLLPERESDIVPRITVFFIFR